MGGDRELRISARESSGTVELRLIGMITERGDATVGSMVKGRRVLVDVGDIKGINSFGVRTWVNFVTELCRQAREVTIQRLPPVLVNQAAMVTNFFAGARVESFLTPWCCLDCDAEQLQLHHIDAEVPDKYRCAECDGSMEFDGLRDLYLSFRIGLTR